MRFWPELSTKIGATPLDTPGDNFLVGRYSHDVLKRSRVGALFVNKDSGGGSTQYNRTMGVDSNFALGRVQLASLGPAPDDLYPTPRALSPADIDTLIVYLQARVVGHGRITRADCLYYYYDSPSSECDDLK